MNKGDFIRCLLSFQPLLTPSQMFFLQVRSICLADPNKFEREKKTYEVCVSAGFGKKKEEKSSPEPEYFGENYRFHLLYGKMNLLYRFTCSHFPQHLCAGSVFPKGVTTGLVLSPNIYRISKT